MNQTLPTLGNEKEQQIKQKASKISPKCYVTELSTQLFNINVTMLCQRFPKLVSRVEPRQLVVFNSTGTCCLKDLQNTDI